MSDSNADMIFANDIGSNRYRKNPNNNEVFVVNSQGSKTSGWKKKEKIVKFIRKEIEKEFSKRRL